MTGIAIGGKYQCIFLFEINIKTICAPWFIPGRGGNSEDVMFPEEPYDFAVNHFPSI